MRFLSRLLLLVAFSLITAACKEIGPVPTPQSRQANLAERILSAATSKAPRSEEAHADAARALAEVVLPSHAPRLRLMAAGSDEVMAAGAAKALVRIRLLRAGGDVQTLVECARGESNLAVQSACVEALPPAEANVAFDLLAHPDAPVRAASLTWLKRHYPLLEEDHRSRLREAESEFQSAIGSLLAPSTGPAPRPRSELEADLRARRPERQLEALRSLLAEEPPGSVEDPRIGAALASLGGSAHPQVALLAAAALLRQSVIQSPPPTDPE